MTVPSASNATGFAGFSGACAIDFTNSGPVAKEGLRRQVCELYSRYLEGRMKQ